jgi:serine/threonine protein kinase
MSPEQARGEPVGVQADIWSCGAILYEMLTGRSPFRRKTTAETFASVLDAQPDYAALHGERSLPAHAPHGRAAFGVAGRDRRQYFTAAGRFRSTSVAR